MARKLGSEELLSKPSGLGAPPPETPSTPRAELGILEHVRQGPPVSDGEGRAKTESLFLCA